MYDGRPASWGWLTGVRSYVRWFDNKRWLINRFPFSFLFLRDAQKQNFLIIQNIDYNAQWGWWWGEGAGVMGVPWKSCTMNIDNDKNNKKKETMMGKYLLSGHFPNEWTQIKSKPNHTKEKKDTRLSLLFQNVNEVWHIKKNKNNNIIAFG